MFDFVSARLRKDDYQYNPDAILEMGVLGESEFLSTNELEEVAEVEELESADVADAVPGGGVPAIGPEVSLVGFVLSHVITSTETLHC